MKKAIIVRSNTMLVNRIEDNNRILREVIAKECGFDLFAWDNINVDIIKNYDLVFIDPYKFLQGPIAKNTMKMMEIPIKIIAYDCDMDTPTDNRKYNIAEYIENRKKFYLRSDKILCDVYWYLETIFKDVYDKIFPKMVWWPKAVVAYDRYFNLPFNENPILKCTLAGKLSWRYPLRKTIYNSCGKYIQYYCHPGYDEINPRKYPIGDTFAVELNKYICGVCPAKTEVRHVLEKYIIIPASGSLLLAERTEDFDRLGMEDGKHYIAINETNVKWFIKDVVRNPAKYREIRLAGREFVKQNHTIKNRLEVLRTVLKEMGDV